MATSADSPTPTAASAGRRPISSRSCAASPDPVDILNWRRLDARITTSGQPNAAQLVALRGIGVRRLVNLGMPDHPHALADEADHAEALGFIYTAIPTPFDDPRLEHFAAFRRALEAAGEEAVHVHCILNARVSAFFHRLRREGGMTEAEARPDLDAIWRPGGVWARFIGDGPSEALPHRYAGRDY